MPSIVAAGRSTARDRYGPACRRPNAQVPGKHDVVDASGEASTRR
jgi:hypothetical protein